MTDMTTRQDALLVASELDRFGNARQVAAIWTQSVDTFGTLTTNADGTASFVTTGATGTVTVTATANGLTATMDLVVSIDSTNTLVIAATVTNKA